MLATFKHARASKESYGRTIDPAPCPRRAKRKADWGQMAYHPCRAHDCPRRQEVAMIRKLHHNAYRCRDSEETRAFYEDFLGLPLAGALEISETKTGRETHVLHTFYRLDDGSFLAFFEAPEPFEFKAQKDFDLHIALEVSRPALEEMLAKGKAQGRETRGVSNHGFIESIYFRDPNGYVIELCAKRADHDQAMDPANNGAREILQRWTSGKRVAV
jgi:catechol 2,3-dioxygenase-like lactoylglutathione lyase family enzyme